MNYKLGIWILGIVSITQSLPISDDNKEDLSAQLLDSTIEDKTNGTTLPVKNDDDDNSSWTESKSFSSISSFDEENSQSDDHVPESQDASTTPLFGPSKSFNPIEFQFASTKRFEYAKNASLAKKVGQRVGHFLLGIKNGVTNTVYSLVELAMDPAGFAKNLTVAVAHPVVSGKSIVKTTSDMFKADPYEAAGRLTLYAATSGPGLSQLSKTKLGKAVTATVSDVVNGNLKHVGSDLTHVKSGLQGAAETIATVDVKNTVVQGLQKGRQALAKEAAQVFSKTKSIKDASEEAKAVSAASLARSTSLKSHPLADLSSSSFSSASSSSFSSASSSSLSKSLSRVSSKLKSGALELPKSSSLGKNVAETIATNVDEIEAVSSSAAGSKAAVTAPQVATAAVVGAGIKGAKVVEHIVSPASAGAAGIKAVVSHPAASVSLGIGATQDHASNVANAVARNSTETPSKEITWFDQENSEENIEQ